MILSESEALWMAEVMHAVRYLEDWDDYFGNWDNGDLTDEETAQIEERFYDSVICRDFGMEVDGNPQPYPIIRDLAEGFGIGSISFEEGQEQAGEPTPADIRWASGGQLITQEDLVRLIDKCDDLVSTFERYTSISENDGDSVDMILLRLTARFGDAPLATGYSLSNPRSLYRLDCDGVIRKWCTVESCPPGLYSTLLQLLLPHMEVPTAVLMSLSQSCEMARERLGNWIPRYADLFTDPSGVAGLAASDCFAIFRSFEQDNHDNRGWRLGKSLAQLRDLIDECRLTVEHFLQCSMSAPEKVSIGEEPTEQHSSPTTNAAHTEAPDKSFEEDYEHNIEQIDPDEDEGDVGTAADRVLGCLLVWAEHDPVGVVADLKSSDVFTGYTRQQTQALLHVHKIWKNFEPLVTSLIDQTEDLRFPNVRELIYAASGKIPTIEQVHKASLKKSFKDEHSAILKNLDDAKTKVNNASHIAYGEFRLRGLKWDDAALPAQAMTAWAQQHQNLREAIRTGISLLNNGAHVYPTLVSLKSAVEALIKRIRAKYFSEVSPSPSINGTLHLLRDRAKGQNDAALLFAANTLQALWDLRCLIEHEPTREYSRSHAVFLLNGLAVLLEEGHGQTGN